MRLKPDSHRMRRHARLAEYLIVLPFVLCGVSNDAQAGIGGEDRLGICFQISCDCRLAYMQGFSGVTPECTLSHSGLMMPPDGVGCLESDVFPIGLAYRPACFLRVDFGAKVREPIIPGDLVGTLRFSCDRVHWSEWMQEPTNSKHFGPNGSLFASELNVPRKDYDRFDELVKKLGDPPRKGIDIGMDAYLRWVNSRDPKILDEVIPLIGYVQFRIYNVGSKPVTISHIDGKASWYVSGLHGGDDPVDFETRWHFDRRPEATQSVVSNKDDSQSQIRPEQKTTTRPAMSTTTQPADLNEQENRK